MKVTVRTDRPIFSGHRTVSFTLDGNYEPSGKSKEEFFTTHYSEDNLWSIAYEPSDGTLCEMEFVADGFSRTLEPVKGLIWVNDAIDSDFLFTVSIN